MEQWEIVANHVVPCPECGMACTGTIRVWYRLRERCIAFETDQGSLATPLDAVIAAANARDAYAELPWFVREWNEESGWASATSNGYPVETKDLMLAIYAMWEVVPRSNTTGRSVLDGLYRFVVEAAYVPHPLRAAKF